MCVLLFLAVVSLQVGLSWSTDITGGCSKEIEILYPSSSTANNPISNKIPDLQNLTQTVEDRAEVTLVGCINDTNFVLTSQLEISKIDHLYVKGSGGSIIHCTGDSDTGLIFTDVTNLQLENLHMLRCGSLYGDSEIRIGSVNFINCNNVNLKEVTIAMSRGVGLILHNTRGQVTVENSIFQNTYRGVEVVMNTDSSQDVVSYKIQNCEFFDNGVPTATRTNQLKNRVQNDFHKRGGGLQLLIGGNLSSSSFIITNCSFRNNSASSGGGMFVVIQDRARKNSINVAETSFIGNTCHNGGGALQIGYIQNSSKYSNSIIIHDCKFENNKAEYGGGTAIFSNLSDSTSILSFTNCWWENNCAKLGLAVDIAIAPRKTYSMNRRQPSPVFADCKFLHNFCTVRSQFVVSNPRSTLAIIGFRVEFKQHTTFDNNYGTAIEAIYSILDFRTNSTVMFSNNRGIEGGALNLKGMTTIYIHDNSSLEFENNTADRSGGAIYVQSYDKHDFFSSSRCFMQYKGSKEQMMGTMKFNNNHANYEMRQMNETNYRHRGDSLYATTFLPCLKECTTLTNVTMTIEEALSCFGIFLFDKPSLKRLQFSTAASHFANTNTEYKNDPMCPLYLTLTDFVIHFNLNTSIHTNPDPINRILHFIPGKIERVPLKLVDDFCIEVFFLVSVKVLKRAKYDRSSISLHRAHNIITDNKITLYGKPNDSGRIQLSTIGFREITLTINVTMDKCPPGYIYNSSTMECRCSNVYSNNYVGIERCDIQKFRAYLNYGYWAGYLNDSNKSEASLATSLCPRGFCAQKTGHKTDFLLPSSASEDLSIHICNKNRAGKLCGTCKENMSASYHSISYTCKTNDLCHLGWVFYIVSELIPVTLLYLMVILLNISFTAGPLNGVIFFMQVINTFKIEAENFIYIDPTVRQLSQIHKVVYRMFTLNIFSLEKLSFCLWRGASALDLMAFKYVTITYSLVLVITTVLLLKICSFEICKKCTHKSLSLKGSILHGLSAFLVMSYSECTRVSLLLVTPGNAHVGPMTLNTIERNVFYNGEYKYMGPEHLKYAIPAIFFIMSMVAIPPLLLFAYPLCYKLFALLGIQESKCLQITCKLLPLEKIKPIFDSIQGAFKDEYRFFAGLYFLYRLCTLTTFALSRDFATHYTITGVQLVCMLTIHAVCRPYKVAWHNALDAALFSNLAIINGMTLYNFQLTSGSEHPESVESVVTRVTGIQSGLILLPLVYLVIYTMYCIVVKLRAACVQKFTARELTPDNSDDILHALDNRALHDDYMLLEGEAEHMT